MLNDVAICIFDFFYIGTPYSSKGTTSAVHLKKKVPLGFSRKASGILMNIDKVREQRTEDSITAHYLNGWSRM